MISDRKTSGVFVKTPVLVQDTYSVEEIAILFRVSRNSVYEWHKREDDPLPLRRMNGKKRGFFAYRDELLEWKQAQCGLGTRGTTGMAERSDEAFIIVREFMTRGLGLTGLPLLVYARIYGFCESGSPYFESKAHLGKILGVDTRSVVRAVRKLEEAGLVFEVGRQELSKGRETKVYRIDFEAARRAKGAIEGAGQSTHGEMPSDDRGPRPCRLLHDQTPCRPLTPCQLITKTENKDYR